MVLFQWDLAEEYLSPVSICHNIAMVHIVAAVGPRQVHRQLAARPALSVTALVHVWHTHTPVSYTHLTLPTRSLV